MFWKKCIVGLATTICWLLIPFLLVGLPIILSSRSKGGTTNRGRIYTISRASVTGFNLTSDGHLTSFFEVVIKVGNLDPKFESDYRDVKVSVIKNKQNLAEDVLSDFTLHGRNVSFIKAEPVALNSSLKKGQAFDIGIETGMGYLAFDVSMTAKLNPDYNLEVNCPHVVVNITSTSHGVVASPISVSEINGHGLRSTVDCSVTIYRDQHCFTIGTGEWVCT